MRGELRELGGNFIEGHSNALSEDDERNPAKHGALVPALPAAATIGRDEAAVFVEPQGGRGNSASTRNFANQHA
jgi:hypothetical protein